MRNLARHAFVLIAVIVVAIWAIVPPSEKLKLGKDLAGGTSLTYQVDIRPTDPSDTLSQVIDLLKRRIDPGGVMEISIEAQGTDRVIITMAQATPAVKKQRQALDDKLAQLGQGNISTEQFDRIVSLPDAERETELLALAAGDPDQQKLLTEVVRLHDAAKQARAEYENNTARLDRAVEDLNQQLESALSRADAQPILDSITQARDAADNERFAAAGIVAQAETAYDAKRNEALSRTISIVEVRRALELPKVERKYKDPATGKTETLDSPRKRALDRLRANYPGASAKLDTLVAEYDAYQANRSTLDDPEDLQRLLRGAGVLTFRIAVQPGELAEEATLRADLRSKGPRAVRSTTARWFKINKDDAWFDSPQQQKALFENPAGYFAGRNYVVEPFDGQNWMLLYDVRGKRLTQAEGAWALRSARPGVDSVGRTAINFEMDALGGEKMAQLTEANKGRPMGVVLDDEVYTAPNIQSKIGNSGQITGTFGDAEIKYIVRVLSAGSLAAKLSPVPISLATISPELGIDNLFKGLTAGVIALIATAVFMVVYYFLCGFVSVLALLLNATMILAAMSLQHAAFSMPAIAGMILTFGMAVDANVLIYERMREELTAGADLKTAVRLGYQRALSSIVDGHMTVLIVCLVLMIVGTQEIKGFAITMSVGAVATLFTQLYGTRWLFAVLVDKIQVRSLSMLPIAVPAVQRAFTFNVDWMKYRFVFLGISTVLTVGSLVTVGMRGSDLLDTEFRGGTKVTIQLKEQPGSGRLTMARADVNDRMIALATASADSADPDIRPLASLRDARVRVVNPTDPVGKGRGSISSTFEIKTDIQNASLLKEALSRQFADVMDVLEPLAFTARQSSEREAPVYPIITDQLADIEGVDATMRIPDFVGGAAVVLADLQPRPTIASLEARLKDIRSKPEYTEAAARQVRWVRLKGTDQAVESVVLLIRDDNFNYIKDQDSWASNLRGPTWRMIGEALEQRATTLSVESFSATVAATFKARAIVAILLSSLAITIYIWVRFASARYSLAAIVTSLHVCVVTVGCIAMCEILYREAPGLATTLGILPFKVDLNVIASLLTILGYSLNDTIVILDRIREKRGKLKHASRAMINRGVNETLSRTVLTGGTTLFGTLVIYIVGGEALRAFAFSFLVGILVGTYSSIALAAPIVWVRKADPSSDDYAPRTASGATAAGLPSTPPGPGQANGQPAHQPKRLS